MTNINTQLPGGFKDYLPEDSRKREYLIEKIIKTFESFGFSLLETPAVESLETLTGGESNTSKQIFEINQTLSDKDSKMGLRFDLTVPLARVISNYNNEIDLPAKLYRLGRVWRGEKSQAGRYREFLQCDADIIGSSSPEADAEMLSLIYKTLKNIGLDNFKIKVSSRAILNEFFNSINISNNKFNNILVELDKLDKLSWDEVKKNLIVQEIKEEKIELIKDFISKDLTSVLEEFKDQKKIVETTNDLMSVIKSANDLGVEDKFIEVDLSIARGLDYYTGPIFETVLTDNLDLGSVFSGGRYDNLLEKFTGSKIPATGVSLGFDRLFDGIKNMDLFNNIKNSNVLVLNFEESCRKDYLRIIKNLREANIRSSLYLGQEDNLKGQLAYAVKCEIPIVLILGKKEKENKVIQVKDMDNRTQELVKEEELIDKIKVILSN
ncbi:MAG: histidine--tRNA ligase [Candidatus Paceibacterota bacterium]